MSRFKIKKNLKFVLGILLIIVIAGFLYYFSNSYASSDKNLKVYFLDVGQGDSEYIKTPDGHDILIDGGPDNSVLNQLGRVMDFGDHEINLVILSHPHADHLSGLMEVLKRYKVGEVWESGVDHPSATYNEWEKMLSEKQIPSKKVKAGDEKNFGDVKIFVLYPLSSLENQTIDNVNNASVINRLEYNKFSVLFLGDAEAEVQRKIADKMKVATVLKTGHHGSKNGTVEEMLEIVRPAIAIISAGAKNKYGHPHAEAINLLRSFAIRIFRTDQNGTIEVDSDGEGYWVITLD